MECPRCFWLDLKCGIKRPPPAPYTINTSIDHLLKAEFDQHRKNKSRHYLLERYNIDALPYNCEHIDTWRNNFTGIRAKHTLSDFLVYGAIDDVWINPKEELFIVDYKATGAKEYKIYDSYRRQMEIYQWLFIKNDYKVSPTGYFVFAKVNPQHGFGSGKLSFDLFVEPLVGDSSWVEDALMKARALLEGSLPAYNDKCPYCQFSKPREL